MWISPGRFVCLGFQKVDNGDKPVETEQEQKKLTDIAIRLSFIARAR